MEERYLMVGEAAKRLGVSVRTLQHYDKIGLMAPSRQSEGGRRLYSDKDIVKLHQIISLKYLGFSLEQIKKKILNLESPDDVIRTLQAQESQVEQKIKSLTEVQKSIAALKEEIKEMNTVDWAKYAGIITLLRNKDENYWAIKHFKEKTIEMAANKFDTESARVFSVRMESLWDRVIVLIDAGKSESCKEAQIIAKEWWDMITGFTGGDMSILKDMMDFATESQSWKNERWKGKFEKIHGFIEKAFGIYFSENQIDINMEELEIDDSFKG